MDGLTDMVNACAGDILTERIKFRVQGFAQFATMILIFSPLANTI